MSYTISMEQIENLISSVENSQPDLTPDYRVGDFVELDTSYYAPAWACGHILRVEKNGLILAYGDKNTPQMFRLIGMGTLVRLNKVVRHWRKVDTVTRSKLDGFMDVVEVGYEWVKI